MKILFENKDFIVVHKPAGVPTHSLRVGETGTMVDLVAEKFPECAKSYRDGKPLDGGVLHRLDVGTSGCLAFARNQQAFDRARKAWDSKNTQKAYLARIRAGSAVSKKALAVDADFFLSRSKKHKNKMLPFLKKPKGTSWQARSTFFLIPELLQQNLVLILIHTGATHQIRASAAAIGLPLENDPTYGEAKPLVSWHELRRPILQTEAVFVSETLSKISPTGSNLHIANDTKSLLLHALSLRFLNVQAMSLII